MNASQKTAQYLGEAKASEDALVRVLQSQIAMTPTGSYRSGLETHLEETRNHSRRLSRRIGELSVGRNPAGLVVGLAEGVLGQALALAKTPLDLVRGSGGEEKVLKNAKDAAATESLEIATYTAIERLAQSVGDDKTAQLAQSIRADEEKMLARIMREIPALTDAVVRAQLKDDPSYEVRKTGAADAVRETSDRIEDAARDAGAAARRTARQARKVPGVAQAEGQVKGAVADEEDRATVLSRIETLRGDEPWPGYDELNVSDVQAALSTRDDRQIEQVRSYESSHKNRAGVIKATERQLAKA
jgi:ferritin-like metal-binding protein YciE